MITFEKKKRVQKGSIHVFCRGNNRSTVFYNDFERYDFIRRLNRIAKCYDTRVQEFTLMDNHFHLQIRTEQLSIFMKSLLQGYVRWYNLRNSTTDKLFKTPFNSACKYSAEWITESKLYILQNPVKAGICEHPSQYKWSSYRFHFKQHNPLRSIIDIDTSELDKEFKTKAGLDKALVERNYKISDIGESQPTNRERVSDHIVTEQINEILNGRSIFTLSTYEKENLIKYLNDNSNASLRQISSVTHENYLHVLKLCKKQV